MLLLKNAKDVHGNSIEILISEEKIKKIDSFIEPTNKMQIINLRDMLIMPGIIDLHTHMREPGFTHKEGFKTGSKACIKGGITTFFDMPNTNPLTITQESLLEKKLLAKKSSCANFGFHFGASKHDNVDEIIKVLKNSHANSVKLFLNVSTGKMLIEEEEVLEKIFKNSKLVLVHAENEMIDKAIELNAKYGNGVYICHIPSKIELEKVIKAKQNTTLNNESHPIYAEITPHHLFLNNTIKNANKENKMLLRMKPELREKSDNDFLLKAINDGFIDTIATDHAPHLISEKKEQPTFGVPGVESSLALMLDCANKEQISLSSVQKLMCENPAKIMKIEKRGELKEGFYADIIAVNMNKNWTLKKADLESKCKWSPFENFNLKGQTYMTIVNGKILYKQGSFNEETNLAKEVEFYD